MWNLYVEFDTMTWGDSTQCVVGVHKKRHIALVSEFTQSQDYDTVQRPIVPSTIKDHCSIKRLIVVIRCQRPKLPDNPYFKNTRF